MHELGRLDHDDEVALLRARRLHPARRSPGSWPNGRSRTAARRVVTLVNDWAPGTEAETAFKTRFTQVGGEIIESIRIPLANPDFAPFLQRIADLKPDTAFIYFPGPQAPVFTKQFAERGLGQVRHQDHRAGRPARRRQSQRHGRSDDRPDHRRALSAAHDSALNKTYVADDQKTAGNRPDFVSLGGYDGLHLIYEALKKTGGDADGDA